MSNFFDVGVSKLYAAGTAGKEKEEERVVSGMYELQRHREGRAGVHHRHTEGALLIVYADRMPRFGYSAHNSGSLPEFALRSVSGGTRAARDAARVTVPLVREGERMRGRGEEEKEEDDRWAPPFKKENVDWTCHVYAM